MEGRPWLRILVICIGFSLLGLPVWSLTHSRQVASPVSLTVPAAADLFQVTLTFVQPPVTFSLEYLGAVLCHGSGTSRSVSCDWIVSIPKEGADLLLKANWPQVTPETPVRVKVTKLDDVWVDKTFWTTGDLVETITVPGKAP